MKDYPGQTISSRIPDWRKFLHPTLPASDTNRDCLPQGRVSSDRVCNSELATSEVGPSRPMPMFGLHVSFRGIPDIERFSACAEPVANDPNRKRAGVYPLPVKWLPVSTAVYSTITVCMMPAWCTIRRGGMLDTSTAVVEDDQAGAHGSRPPEQPAHLDLLDDDREAQPVIERVGDPAVTFRDVTKVDSSMVVGDRAPVSRMLELAHQLEGLARLDKPVDVAPGSTPAGDGRLSSLMRLG